MSVSATVEPFLAAFSTADFGAMGALLAPDLVAWVTNSERAMDRVAERGGRTLDNFAAHLLRVDGDGRIAGWWMVDAKPAESGAFCAW